MMDEEEVVKEEEDENQLTFGYIGEIKDSWREEWQDMPEYIQEDLSPWKTLYVHFEDMKDLEEFAKLVEQKITELS